LVDTRNLQNYIYVKIISARELYLVYKFFIKL